MELVAFLIESTGERLDCLLNPESLEITRTSGVRERRLGGHLLSGRGSSEHPLLYAGGGTTTLVLSLLFDVALQSPLQTRVERTNTEGGPRELPQPETQDVRRLTERIWALAEHAEDAQARGHAPLARLIWGKAWNVLGLVTTVSERFEGFSSAGVPQQSWLRLSFRRVPDVVEAPREETFVSSLAPEVAPAWLDLGDPSLNEAPPAPPADPDASEPLYNAVARLGLSPSAWREIAYLNQIEDPLHVPLDRPLLGGSNTVATRP